MENFKNTLSTFLSLFNSDCNYCSHQNCFVSSLRGLTNGLYHGGKVRLVHSLVIVILFGKSESLHKKIGNIIKPTIEHATNLGLFVLIYKTMVCLLKKLFKSNNKILNFLSGIIGAFFMWRKRTNVNMQIMLYLLSRNIFAVSNIIKEKYLPNFQCGFPIASLLVWGVVMFLFEINPKALQNSLKNSMDFLYKDSDVTNGWRDFFRLM